MVKMTKYDLKPIVKLIMMLWKKEPFWEENVPDADISSFLLICAVTSAEVWIPSGWI